MHTLEPNASTWQCLGVICVKQDIHLRVPLPPGHLRVPLPATDCTQPSTCACIRPGVLGCCLDYNMYTTSACVMHCQLPRTKASQGAACSPSRLPPESLNRLQHMMHRCPGADSASHTLLHFLGPSASTRRCLRASCAKRATHQFLPLPPGRMNRMHLAMLWCLGAGSASDSHMLR